MMQFRRERPSLLDAQHDDRERRLTIGPCEDTTAPIGAEAAHIGRFASDDEADRAFEESWGEHEASYRYLVDR